jgi:hypothetical protein
MRKLLPLLLFLASVLALATSPAFAAESSFERSYKVKGLIQVSVGTGLGSIRINVGAPNRVHVIGHVKSDWGGNPEARVQKVADSPPVGMSENVIQLGAPNQDPAKNMSIDYEIEAPAESMIFAVSGAGDITVIGVGTRINLRSGSGDIHVSEVRGQLHAQSSTGDITIGGVPTGDWLIDSGSGSIELWSATAPLTVEASTGNGRILSDQNLPVQQLEDKRRVSAKLNGGGPTVRISTDTGDVHVH